MNLSRYLWIVLILLCSFASFLVLLNEPFFGHREGGSIWIASAIRTYEIYGMEAVDYLPIRTPGPTDPETGRYYLHHPPLIVWINALGVKLFGYDSARGMPFEASLRLVAIFFCMPTLSLMYILAGRLAGRKTALLAMLLYSVTPMTIYFSRTPYYDMLIMPFILLYTLIFYEWMKDYNRKQSWMLLVLAVLMMWIAWVAAFFLAALAVIALLYGNRQQRIWMILIGLLTAAVTLLIPVLYESLRPGSIAELVDVFFFRVSNLEGGPESESFTALEFLGNWVKDMLTAVSIALTVFGAWGLAVLAMRPQTLQTRIIFALALAPFVFMLVFRNAFYFHDWYKIHYMPALAIAGAWAVYRGWQLEPIGLQRYAKPFIVAISFCSVLVCIYWVALMHLATFNFFARTLAAEIPLYTAEGDMIASNITRPYSEIDYYAYRNITWGTAIDSALSYYEETPNADFYYLYCPESEELAEPFEGIFPEFPYEVLADSCRLIHVTKEGQ